MTDSKSPSSPQQQVLEFLRGLTLQQRLLLAGGTVLVAGTLWLFVTLIAKPKMVTLYSGLRPSEAQNLVSRLAVKNIAYEMSADGGALLVPSDRIDEARLETASQGLPRNARMGFELFDTPNWAGSDFAEKVNYQRALEGELERTLQTLAEVEAVRVHLVLPRESLFLEREQEAKAAVILKTRTGRLSEQAQQAIPQLVASAVDRLRPENVTVVDADSNAPLLHAHGGAAGSGYDLDEELGRTLLRTLEPVVGADHVRASVHVEYDLGSSEDTQEIYDPKGTAATALQRSEESAGGGAPAGIPGTASNVPGAATVGNVPLPGADQSSSKSESSTYAVSKSVHHSIQPAGRVRRLAAAVLVDDAVEYSQQNGQSTSTRRKRTPEELKEIEKLASAAIGIDTQRGDLLAVENLSFQSEPVERIATPGKWERWRKILEQWAGALRYGGVGLLFLVVYFLVLRPVKKQILHSFRQLPARLSHASQALGGGVTAGMPGALENPELAGLDQNKRGSQLRRELTDKVKGEPAAASRLVHTWIRQEKAHER